MPQPVEDVAMQPLTDLVSAMSIEEDQLKLLKENLKSSFDEFQKGTQAVRGLVPTDKSCVLDQDKMSAELKGKLNYLGELQTAVKAEFEETKELLQAEGSQPGDIAIRCMKFEALVGGKKLTVDAIHTEVRNIVDKFQVTPERKLALSTRKVNKGIHSGAFNCFYHLNSLYCSTNIRAPTDAYINYNKTGITQAS